MSGRRLKIGMASSGRFHLLDVARGLTELGHDVKFYSYVPRRRAEHFGLSPPSHVSLLPFVVPLLALEKASSGLGNDFHEKAMCSALDRLVIMRLQPCDVFIFMSGIYLKAARYAKEKFGARCVLVRGSRHILSQYEILKEYRHSQKPSRFIIERELAGYDLADRISIPSSHVEESFHDHGITKTHVLPYGVELENFPYNAVRPHGDEFTFLSVGQWSLRKGSDILVRAVRRLEGCRLLHVGTLVDVEFPSDDNRFEHVEPVQQQELRHYYERSDVLVLASREDGFGVVLAQALASGLPIVCSDFTGGADLVHTAALAERISVVPGNDSEALAAAMTGIRDRLRDRAALPPLTEADLETLSWQEYARSFSSMLVNLVSGGGSAQ